jgi:hypothetical protein
MELLSLTLEIGSLSAGANLVFIGAILLSEEKVKQHQENQLLVRTIFLFPKTN